MGIKSVLAKPFASYIHKKTEKWSSKPVETQKEVFNQLLKRAGDTKFGVDHSFSKIGSFQDFSEAVPVRDYEGHRPYVEKILQGQSDVLWPGKPKYFAKTSGTTSGIKYIPLTNESIPNHINSARDALLAYVHQTGNSSFLDKNMIFLSGSPEMEKKGGIYYGRLSGIVNHHVPSYLQKNQKPSYKTNCIEDWEEKLDSVISETLDARMSLISGIPPWVQMYFDRIHEKTGKLIKDVFPEFEVFVYGGVNFEPYRKKLFKSIGREVDSVETYPASEGFLAYQDTQDQEGLLLLLNHGIFYEFIPAEEFYSDNPTRLTIGEVQIGVNYAVIMSTNAGLWSYSIGDTVKFVSLDPCRVIVSGRIKHFISAFGEHVIGEEVEKAMRLTLEQFSDVKVVEFTVAPFVSDTEGQSFHEWLISFDHPPQDINAFSEVLDNKLTEINAYYDDLITGNILKKLKITTLKQDAFIEYMRGEGKLGGQNKVPRLSNDREIADKLQHYIL